ncbi:hypothetical protein CRI70_01445 [Streptomyces sp. Ru87]|nr:hypothetical protein CRI70_01445 [Streptomyces sp. Ru87]
MELRVPLPPFRAEDYPAPGTEDPPGSGQPGGAGHPPGSGLPPGSGHPRSAGHPPGAGRPPGTGDIPRPAGHELLGAVAGWGETVTPAGRLRLLPVRAERDLALVTAWMNDPAVAALWGLGGPEETTAAHLRAQLDGDGRSVPCLGLLDGVPMSYWEIYRADLAPLARHYPARPHDTGLRLLIGAVADRGRGIGSCLLRAVSGLVLDNRPSCTRVVAEPDLRNAPSVAAFLRAGFRFSAEVGIPDRRAALMMRERSLRDLL